MVKPFNVKRMDRLSSNLAKYAHRWGENPSARMTGWVDEYNDAKEQHPQAFAAWCAQRGFAPDHDAYDCLA